MIQLFILSVVWGVMLALEFELLVDLAVATAEGEEQ